MAWASGTSAGLRPAPGGGRRGALPLSPVDLILSWSERPQGLIILVGQTWCMSAPLALGARSSLVPQGHRFLGLSPESRWLCLDWPLRGFTPCSLPPTLLPDGLQSLGAGPG